MNAGNNFSRIKDDAFGRRKFIAVLTKAAGSAVLFFSPVGSMAGNFFPVQGSRTVGQIMDLFIAAVPGGPIEKTVDTLKAGHRDIKVSGIVTTMFATLEVIQKAIALGANFIIAHEPVFYNHLDETAWLEKDAVYRYKAALLKKHNMAVWRNHDYVHRYNPDGVQTALVNKLGWGKYYNPELENPILIPATNLKALIQHVKGRLGIATVRYIGDLAQSCQKVLLMPGASGGKRQIEMIGKEKPDVILCGELSEWETAEYVRDARAQGQKLSLVVMGHADSEEPGSGFMAQWLKAKVPDIKVTHIPSKNPLSFY
jgi:putative NIF3 family GTP cyclohydrolase 1 type 2